MFRAAAEADEEGDPLGAMGKAYVELLADRELLLAQMQTYAACGDDESCRRSRAGGPGPAGRSPGRADRYHGIAGRRLFHMRWGRLTSLHHRWNAELVTRSIEHAAAEGIAADA